MYVAFLGRDGQREQFAGVVQGLAEPGDEPGQQRAVGGVDAFEVQVEPVVALGQGVADDLLNRVRGGVIVGE